MAMATSPSASKIPPSAMTRSLKSSAVMKSAPSATPWVTVIDPLVVIGPPLTSIRSPAVRSIDVTVPPLDGDTLVMVKLGYVPVTPMPDPAVRTTVWSGSVLVMVMVSVEALVVIATPVPLAKVNVSLYASATTLLWPDTSMVENALMAA